MGSVVPQVIVWDRGRPARKRQFPRAWREARIVEGSSRGQER